VYLDSITPQGNKLRQLLKRLALPGWEWPAAAALCGAKAAIVTLTCLHCLQDMNIYELIRGRRHYIAEERVRSYMYQLMKALDHMHRNGIFHR